MPLFIEPRRDSRGALQHLIRRLGRNLIIDSVICCVIVIILLFVFLRFLPLLTRPLRARAALDSFSFSPPARWRVFDGGSRGPARPPSVAAGGSPLFLFGGASCRVLQRRARGSPRQVSFLSRVGLAALCYFLPVRYARLELRDARTSAYFVHSSLKQASHPKPSLLLTAIRTLQPYR